MGQELQKQGLVTLQATHSREYVLERGTVNQFATVRDLLMEIVKAFAEDAFATGLVPNNYVPGFSKLPVLMLIKCLL